MLSVQSEHEYEDLLGLWSDLEAGVAVILGSPAGVQEFAQRVWQYDRWMQDLLRRDADVGLYLLFQLAGSSSVGYSASHALVCAVLCHLTAIEMQLAQVERDALVHAALTMNIAMTNLQDELTGRPGPPSRSQHDAIRAHPAKGAMMLSDIGIDDALWLGTVAAHHDESDEQRGLQSLEPPRRLARIVRSVDRYGAMISPRKARAGRSATDSMRSVLSQPGAGGEVGRALVRTVGLCPPGTYVQMDNGEIAVVMRRSPKANHPHVAIVLNETGQPCAQPRLHRTAQGGPQIRSAMAAGSVRVRLNHHLILQLGAYAGRQA